jgi:hypothetical protein
MVAWDRGVAWAGADMERDGRSDLSLSPSSLDEVVDFLFEQGTEHLTGHGWQGGGCGEGAV